MQLNPATFPNKSKHFSTEIQDWLNWKLAQNVNNELNFYKVQEESYKDNGYASKKCYQKVPIDTSSSNQMEFPHTTCCN